MKALIIIDMLNDFVSGKLACDRAQRIIPNIKELAEAFRDTDQPVIFNHDAHLPEVDAEFEIWGPHAVKGTEGAEVIPELEPEEDDIIIPKRRYSGFDGTDLQMQLEEYEVDTVVLTGLHTNMCVRHTSYDAYLNNYEILIPEDCTEAFDQEQHENGLEYIEMMYGGEITTSSDIIEDLMVTN